MLDEHPWGAKTHALAIAFLPTFVGDFLYMNPIPYSYDLVD